MSKEENSAAITKTAFNCPHCDAYTTQHWGNIFIQDYSEKVRTPFIPNQKNLAKIKSDTELNQEDKIHLIEWCHKMDTGKPFIEFKKESPYIKASLQNVFISKCYNCKEISIWVHETLVYPNMKIDIRPNRDLPDNVKKLFEEAREIVNQSPKGAAALLRLCIQYLCKELGESGKNIDKDIASLVSKGLNPLVQKALDIVRVIGNESVHPGEIDLNDNKETAIKLFSLINLVCEQMISHPKQVNELYNNLPEGKLNGIDQRNRNAMK